MRASGETLPERLQRQACKRNFRLQRLARPRRRSSSASSSLNSRAVSSAQSWNWAFGDRIAAGRLFSSFTTIFDYSGADGAQIFIRWRFCLAAKEAAAAKLRLPATSRA